MNAPEQASFLDGGTDQSEPPRLVARISSLVTKIVFPFVAQDDIRYYLNGINVRPLADETAMIVATDGHRFIVVRDPQGYVEREVIVRVDKDALKHADAENTFDVMSNGHAQWNDKATLPVFIQPGQSVIEGTFPRIENVFDAVGYLEGISGAVNLNYLADVLKIKIGAKAPAIRFFSKDEDSPLLFVITGIGDIEVFGGVMKLREAYGWLPTWIPARGEFELHEG